MTTSDNNLTENQTNTPQNFLSDEDEINLLDILIVLAKHKKMIIGVTLAAVLISVVVSLLLPNIYTAKTKILPPQPDQSVASSMLNQLGGQLGGLAGIAGIKNPNDLYVAMLNSRNVMGKVVKRFDLQKVYAAKTMTDTLKILKGNVKVTSGNDGVITVAVDDKDPKLAADIANAYIEELNKLMQTFSLTDASHRRIFFEQQLKEAKDKLTDAEVILDRTPNTSMQYLDALRNMKYRESIYEILAKQFEMAKLDEAKDYPLIQVLDKASIPEKKSKPKRSVIVLVAAILAMFFSTFWAFFREMLERSREDPRQRERLDILKQRLSVR